MRVFATNWWYFPDENEFNQEIQEFRLFLIVSNSKIFRTISIIINSLMVLSWNVLKILVFISG